MTRNPQCPDALLARACRNALLPEEEEQLGAHLRRCDSCRVARRVATDFAHVPSVLPGDDQLIAQITARLTKRKRFSRPRAMVMSLIAAALIAFGALAAAWTARFARSHAPDQGAARAQTSAGIAAASAPTAIPTDPSAMTATAENPSSAIAPNAIGRERTGDDRRGHGDRIEHAEGTAKSLFAEANRLRSAGQVPEAIVADRLLQEQFPHSFEANLSRVSMGSLLMGRSDAEPALAQFKRYLSSNPSGVLREEALFGEARALRALGRSSEELEAWNDLLAAYPGSVYAPMARARAQQLR